MNRGNLTTVPEITAYLAAHLFGWVMLYLLNPIIFRALVAGGHQAIIQVAMVSASLLIMLIVMLLFFIVRRVFAGGI
jgi:hypothetical protein